MANTKKLIENKTMPLVVNERESVLPGGVIHFIGEADEYDIYADKRIGDGGESQNYQAIRLSDGLTVIAKIYDNYIDNPINREKRKGVLQFQKKHSDYQHSHIMPLLDSGMLEVESQDNNPNFHFPVDILPECTSLEKYKASYSELKQKFIPELLAAIECMHKENLIHRDIKPANIYLYNKEVVLADFGTCSEVSGEEQAFYGTAKRQGTLGYAPPEVWQGYAVMASDYFELGCTIASLYHGEHVYQRLIDSGDMSALNIAMNTKGLPLNCKKEESDLQNLVDSLVIMDAEKRAGVEEVKAWLKDSKKYMVQHKAKGEDTSIEKVEPDFRFQFENVLCKSTEELVQAMMADPENAKAYIYRGGVQNSAVVNFFASRNQAIAVRIAGVIEAPETAYQYDLGLAKCLHIMKADSPFFWEGRTYDKLSELSDAIHDKKVDRTYVKCLLKSGYLSWKLKELKASNQVVKVVEHVEELASKSSRLAMNLAMYQFDSEKKYSSYHGCQSADEIFKSITRNPKLFYKNVAAMVHKDYGCKVYAYLIYLGNESAVMHFLDARTEERKANIERFYRLFEALCTDKKMVRSHYLKYGPDSHLFWVREHLNLYHFHTQDAKRIEKKIQNVAFSNSMTIDEIAVKFVELKNYKKELMAKFNDNMLLAYMGYFADSKSDITSNHSDAYFTGSFLGERVPAGYMRYIEEG